ncbi:multicopper oxidase domain-containing protein [Mariniluteicoccus endophyticus]
MRRRTLLAAAAVAPLVACASTPRPRPAPWEPRTRLPIPPELRPTDGRIDLTLQVGRHAYVPGKPVEAWGVNGPVLGPSIRVRRGETVTAHVHNTLPETTTLHWHGLHVPAAVDGGPHQPIDPGETWRPELPIEQPGATCWYHPHTHGKTAAHVHRGLAGLLLVDDGRDAALPQTYGVDDLPLVIQDRTFDADGRPTFDTEPNFGQLGDEVCVNGVAGAWVEVTTEHVRFRVLNGSNARRYHLGFADGRPFAVVAGDLGLLPSPVDVTRVAVGPGERVEVVVRFSPGERVRLVTATGRERIDAGDLTVLEVRAAAQLATSPAPPQALGTAAAIVPPPGARARTFTLQGHDEINGRSMDMSRIDEVVPAGAVEVWELTNTVYAHNFHVHGVAFSIMEVDGHAPAPEESGWKDTVHLPPRSRARLAVAFGRHTDPHHPYMVHCHILRHEDAGMMGQFVVVAPGTEDATPRTIRGH